MGMGEAFSDQANLSRMIDGVSRGIAIGDVKHKTFIEVNEEGTEAAAVTSVDIVVTSMPPSVYVNKPFLFMIREKSTGTVLFIGKIMNPA
jgi:serpin B